MVMVNTLVGNNLISWYGQSGWQVGVWMSAWEGQSICLLVHGQLGEAVGQSGEWRGVGWHTA